jgi:Leucine-rich repeat (LRR) protein
MLGRGCGRARRGGQERASTISAQLVVIVYLAALCCLSCVRAETYSADFIALGQLYAATGGRDWVYQSTFGHPHWQFIPGADPCGGRATSWYGITCEELPPCNASMRCRVTGVDLNNVGMVGTLPSEVANLDSLRILSISDNPLLGGLIPTEIGRLTNLTILNISYNALESTIPLLGSLTSLTYLHLGNNKLTGEVPDLWTLDSLNFLYLFSNSFHGSLPACIGSLTGLRFLQISDNEFSGKIPSDIYKCSELEYLGLAENLLSGTLPYLGLDHLKVISWHDNYFSGQIPPCYGELLNLTFFRVDNCFVSGTIPQELSQLANIETMLLFGNSLQGPIDNVFSPTQSLLSVVDFSGNALSGAIPDSVFELPSLNILSFVKNCFHGSIPESVCGAEHLKILLLDGLTAAEKCSSRMWDPLDIAPSYFARTVPGMIPSCVWTLPNITTVSLSGNGISDKLPRDLQLSDSLVYVDVSYNQLKGEIPDNFQEHVFAFADLSHNKFCGDMAGFSPPPEYPDVSASARGKPFVNHTTLNLAVNRLTGAVPVAFQSASNVQLEVLEGNTFECESMDQLPQSDPQHDTYICGSDELTHSLILLLGSFSFGLFVVACYSLYVYLHAPNSPAAVKSRKIKRSGSNDRSWQFSVASFSEVKSMAVLLWRQQRACTVKDLSDCLMGDQFADSEFAKTHMDISNAAQFLKILILYRNLCLQLAVLGMCVCVPIYVSFYRDRAAFYSSHDKQYGWVYSMAFLSGSLPASVLLALFSLISVYVLFRISLSDMELSENSPSGANRNGNDFEDDCPSRHLSVSHQLSSDSNSEDNSLLDPRESLVSAAAQSTVSMTRARKETFDDELGRCSLISPPSSTLGRASFMESFKMPTKESVLQVGRDSMVVIHKTVNAGGQQANRALSYIVVFVVNGVINILVNILYVVALASNTNSEMKFFFQFFMAMYKLIWNAIFVRALINRLRTDRRRMQLHILILIFNNLIAPCLAIAAGSAQCFEEIFTGSQTVSTSYSFTYCKESSQIIDVDQELHTLCTHYEDMEISTEFMPPYVYSYQCAPTLIIAYVPVFIYSYACLAVFTPLFYAILASLPLSTLSRFIPAQLASKVDGILRPQDWDTAAENGEDVRYEYMLHAHSLIARYSVHLIVLLTFGLCYPPLAVVIFLAIASSTLTWQVLISRFITFGSSALGGKRDNFGDKEDSGNGAHGSSSSIGRGSSSSSLGPSEYVNASMATVDENDELVVPAALAQLVTSPLLDKSSEAAVSSAASSNSKSQSHSQSHPSSFRNIETSITRLQDLEEAIAGAWVNLRASSQLIFTCSMFFYIFEMFDVAGNSYSDALSQIWVPVTGFSFLILVKLVIWAHRRKYFANFLRQSKV